MLQPKGTDWQNEYKNKNESEVMRGGWKVPKAQADSVHKSLERLQIVDNFSICWSRGFEVGGW